MRIDLVEKKKQHEKRKKIGLILSIVFMVLTMVSIALFIVFSNYKIQLLMSIIGSVVSSLLAVTAIGFFTLGYLYNKYLSNFYASLDSKEEQFLNGQISVSSKYLTLKKGLSFLTVYVNDNEYYLADEEMYKTLEEGKNYSIYLRGNYVVGMMCHE